MYRYIELENFQGYRGKYKIPLARKNIIFGNNDSGKSTIRKAFEVFSYKHTNSENISLINQNCTTSTIVIATEKFYVKAFLDKRSTTYYLYDVDMNLIGSWSSFCSELSDALGIVSNSEVIINALSNKKIFIDTSPTTNTEFLQSLYQLPDIEEKISNIQQGIAELTVEYNKVVDRANSLANTFRDIKYPVEKLENLIDEVELIYKKESALERISNYLYSIQYIKQTENITKDLYNYFTLNILTQKTLMDKIIYYYNILYIINLTVYVRLAKKELIKIISLYMTANNLQLILHQQIKMRIKVTCPNCGTIIK